MKRLSRNVGLALRSIREDGSGFLTLWPRVRNSVPGWLAAPDARRLYALAHHGPVQGAIVEIGSAWGRSTVVLATGSKRARRERVYAIDPHTGDPTFLAGLAAPSALASASRDGTPFQPQSESGSEFSSLAEFQRHLKRFAVDDWVEPVVATSTDAVGTVDPGPIRLLFVDGLHTYEGVKADIDNWVPRVARGGVVVFDDYFNDRADVGVRRAVDELVATGSVDSPLHYGRAHVWTTKR